MILTFPFGGIFIVKNCFLIRNNQPKDSFSANLNGSSIFDSSDSDSTVEETKPEVEEVPVEKPKRKRGRPPKSAPKVEKPQVWIFTLNLSKRKSL